MDVGTLSQIWRYPVKSMAGESLEAAAVDEFGIDGDRRFALLDVASGKVASAKRPRRWGDLLLYRAALDGEGVRITAPGEPTHVVDDASLSKVFDREVRLISQPPARAVVEET